MTKEEVIKKIVEACNEIGAPVPVLLAIASMESSLNQNSKSGSGTYWGLFQFNNGWADGCIYGNDRLDIEKSVKAFWNKCKNSHYRDKERWKQIDNNWNDFYYYGIHQQGFSGFSQIYKSLDKTLNQISSARKNNILKNKPNNMNWTNVQDWFDYFRNKFYSLYNDYKKYDNRISQNNNIAINVPSGSLKNKPNINKIFGALGCVLAIGTIYLIFKK